jgi:hypothetical protein
MYYVNITSKINVLATFETGGFNIPAYIDLDIVHSNLRYTSCFLNCDFGVDMQDLYSQIPSDQNSILFSSAHCFLVLGKIHYFIWRPYAAEHGMILI